MVVGEAGLVLLLTAAIAEYAKVRNKADRGFSWLAIAGVLLVFAAVTPSALPLVGVNITIIADLVTLIGWILALVGAVFVAYEALLER